ncbi:MAG: hypothetical protein LBI64_03420 [Coriobacteriales bacterium]|jgi:16S rRNA processing protein RimM|nr:hypothetical protein [Coriobacteriales bacterium]
MKATEIGYRRIAYISRSKGLKGDLIVQPAGDRPLSSYVGERIWIVPPLLEAVRETRLLELKEQAKDSVVRLADVKDVATARLLAGHYLLAETSSENSCANQTGETYEPTAAPRDPIGLAVIEADTQTVLGTIQEVRRTSAQELWVVDGGPYGEVLIPAVEAFILSIDATTALVSLPGGLLELNH